jgi:7-cyano-7-deazaguanine reductase
LNAREKTGGLLSAGLIAMARHPTHLGRKSILTARQIARPRIILDTFANPNPGRDYRIELVFPEFTSVCPVTGQPDFATIRVTYTPDKKCLEMKSLKLYFLAFRDKGIFFEAAINAILDDLAWATAPRSMTVAGEFAVRGGMSAVVTASHSEDIPF